MSKMSEMSFVFSLNVILSMLKMPKMGKEHTHTFLYRVCDMSKMSEMLFSFFFECNSIYVEDVEDRSNTPEGCNAMYVKDVEDGKRTYIHIFV